MDHLNRIPGDQKDTRGFGAHLFTILKVDDAKTTKNVDDTEKKDVPVQEAN